MFSHHTLDIAKRCPRWTWASRGEDARRGSYRTNPCDRTLTSTTGVTGKLHPVRKGHAKRYRDTPQVAWEPVRRPARLAIMLALAHKIQHAIDRGVVIDRAEVARRLGLTRARVTQLLDLTLLAPDIQEAVLALEAVDGAEPVSERALRNGRRHPGLPALTKSAV